MFYEVAPEAGVGMSWVIGGGGEGTEWTCTKRESETGHQLGIAASGKWLVLPWVSGLDLALDMVSVTQLLGAFLWVKNGDDLGCLSL